MEKIEREIQKQTAFKLFEKDEFKSCWKIQADFNCLNCKTKWEFEINFDLFLDGDLFGETWNKYVGGDWSKSDDFSLLEVKNINEIIKIENDFYKTIKSAKDFCYICREI